MSFPAFAFSITDLRRVDACGIDRRIADLSAHLGRAPAEDEQIPMSVWWALPSTSAADAAWSLRLDLRHGAEAAQRVAIYAARAALPVWEAAYPDDARPRAAIEAAEAVLSGVGGAAARNAAGYAAAYAGYAAADAAAATAYAAYAAAAYAGYAAADAPTAAADAIRAGVASTTITAHLRGLYGLSAQ